jgi:hypothetical protein
MGILPIRFKASLSIKKTCPPHGTPFVMAGYDDTADGGSTTSREELVSGKTIWETPYF